MNKKSSDATSTKQDIKLIRESEQITNLLLTPTHEKTLRFITIFRSRISSFLTPQVILFSVSASQYEEILETVLWENIELFVLELSRL